MIVEAKVTIHIFFGPPEALEVVCMSAYYRWIG